MKASRIIAVEEHFITRAIEDVTDLGYTPPGIDEALRDLGELRIASMDDAGIDVQVLSHTVPGVQNMDPKQSVELACLSNDELAAACSSYPTRFVGLAQLPMPDPDAAAAELDRAVHELGLKGAVITGTTNGRFLDDLFFDPTLALAEQLGVPLYLHPSPPLPAVQEAYYSGFSGPMSSLFGSPGWGWHIETGVHLVRMALGGVFDRHPSLQMVTGHLGQAIPFMLERMSGVLNQVSDLDRPLGEYFVQNMYYGTTCFMTPGPLACAIDVVGADRLMFAVDYPYHKNQTIVDQLDNCGLQGPVVENIAHKTAERVFRIDPALSDV